MSNRGPHLPHRSLVQPAAPLPRRVGRARRGRAADLDRVLISHHHYEHCDLQALATSNQPIAEQLVLSERTVETHAGSIPAKPGYSTRTEVAAWSLSRATRQPARRPSPCCRAAA